MKEIAGNQETKIPKNVQKLLDKHKELMIEDLPPGLPPDRSISHKIILSSNETPYR